MSKEMEEGQSCWSSPKAGSGWVFRIESGGMADLMEDSDSGV